jgi:hypothetical protein
MKSSVLMIATDEIVTHLHPIMLYLCNTSVNCQLQLLLAETGTAWQPSKKEVLV